MNFTSGRALPFGIETKWFVAHVDPVTGSLFCQLREPSIVVEYDRLCREISGWAKRGRLELPSRDPLIGELYLVKFGKTYSRARINGIEDDAFEVFFIDYGNTEFVTFDELRILPSEWPRLLPQAHECMLANVEPATGGQWSRKAIDLIKELALERELAGIAERLAFSNVVILKLFVGNSSVDPTVADQLISIGFARPKPGSSRLGSSNAVSSSTRSKSVSSGGSGSQDIRGKLIGSSRIVTLPSLKYQMYDYIDLCVCFIESLASFYCQPIAHSSELKAMQERMNSVYSRGVAKLSQCIPDAFCCAKYSLDDNWYRAQIKAKDLKTKSWLLYFVDFGNTDKVAEDHICELLPEFQSLATMAIECTLAGIRPPIGVTTFEESAFDWFEEHAFDKTLVGQVLSVSSKGRLSLYLYDITRSAEQSINQELIQAGYASLAPLEDAHLNGSSVPGSPSTPSDSDSDHVINYVLQSVAIGSVEDVYVTFSLSPSLFYVQLAKASSSLEQLMSDIAGVYEPLGPNDEILKHPYVSMPCAVQFSEDGRYYRAEILEVTDAAAKVFFVDYGNTEERPWTVVKSLRKEFIKLPKQAVSCLLAGISPIAAGTFSEEALGRFYSLVTDKTLKMTVVDIKSNGACCVNLIEENSANTISKVDVALTLVQAGLASACKAPSEKVDYGYEVKRTSNETYKQLKVDVNSYIEVAPLVVVDPSYFCCHMLQNEQEFKALTMELNSYYKKSVYASSDSYCRNMPCVALYDVDQCWYRATVVSLLQSGEAEVLFVDFGNTAVVHRSNLRPMLASFLELPAQVFSCCLADVAPLQGQWSNDANEMFEELVLDKHLAAYIKSKASDGLYHVELFSSSSSAQEVSISQKLVSSGHAKSVEVSKRDGLGCASYLDFQNSETVFVTAVDSPRMLWLQLTRLSKELDSLMEKIHATYSKQTSDALVLRQPKVGQFCCAQFSGDDGWYRGIIETVKGTCVGVRYIDYGNREEVAVDRVKVLHPDYENCRRMALPCCLQEFLEVASNPAFDQACSAYLLDKEFVAEFVKRSDPIVVRLLVNGKSVGEDIKGALTPNVGPVGTGVGVAGPRQYTFASLRRGVPTKVLVVHVVSPAEFYCQLSEYCSDYEHVLSLLEAYDVSKEPVVSPCLGLPCATRFSEDQAWYRARILALESGYASAQFVDFGNSERVPLNQFYLLSDDLLKIPVACVKCSLDTQGRELSAGVMDFLLSKVLNHQVQVVATGKNVDCYNVELCSENGDKLGSSLFAASTPTPSASLRYSGLQLPVKFREKGYVASIDSASSIYVHLNSKADALEEVQSLLKATADLLVPCASPRVGLSCVAKFSEDGVWYRAEIIALGSDDQVQVLFVDYGNTDTVRKSDVKCLSKELSTHPKLALRCSLNAVASASREDLEARLMDSEVEILVLSESQGLHNVDMFVSGKLVNQDFSKTTRSSAKTAPSLDKADLPTDIPQCTYKVGDVLSVLFLEGESPHLFYVQPSDSMAQLDELMGEIEAFVREADQTRPEIRVGQICLAVFGEDGAWYRARITGVNVHTKRILVHFVDYGNDDVVSLEQLRVIPRHLAQLPCQALRMSLGDILPVGSTWTNGAIELFESVCRDQLLHLRITGCQDGLWLATTEGKDSLDVASKLVSAGFAKAPSTLTSPKAVRQFGSFPLQANASVMVNLSFVSSATNVHVRVSELSVQLDSLLEDVAAYCGASEHVSQPSFDVGTPCFALYDEDMNWYRAEITGADKGIISVHFVDFGNDSTVSTANLRGMPDKYLDLPKSCVSCVLHDVFHEDVDVNGAKSWLETLVGQNMKLEVIEVLGASHVSGYLTVPGSGLSVNDTIYEKFASCADVPSAPKLSSAALEKNEEVFCTVIMSCMEIRCQLAKFATQLEELMGELAVTYSSLPAPATLAQGDACVAKYSGDDNWYRGEVLSFDNGVAVIDFVDYGNVEAVSLENVRSCPASMCQLPKACVSCTLHDVHVDDIDVARAQAWLEQTCLELPLSLEIVSKVNNSVAVYAYLLGRDHHINDYLYEHFSLGVEPELQAFFPPYPELAIESTEVVTCFHVDSALSISCHLLERASDVDVVMSLIKEKLATFARLPNPEPGVFCVAKCSRDGDWYRAQVISRTDVVARVVFIDYGHVDFVSTEDMRHMNSEIAAMPMGHVVVRLRDVDAHVIDPVAGKAWLESNCLGQDLHLRVVSDIVGGVVEGYVYPIGKSVHINDLLCERFQGEHRRGEPANHDQVAKPDTEQLSPSAAVSSLPRAKLSPETLENALCCSVITVNTMKCQLSKYMPKLRGMCAALESSGDGLQTLSSPVIGQICLAECAAGLSGSDATNWCRVIVKSVADGTAAVTLIDYGREEVVSVADLRSLSADLAEFPAVCVDVVLSDVHESDLAADAAKAWLEETSLGKVMRLEFTRIVDASTIEAYVYAEGRSVHVNDMLYELFALGSDPVNVSSVPYPDLSASSIVAAVCCGVQSGVAITCQLSQYSQAVEDLGVAIQSAADLTPPLLEPVVGEFCLASYSVDGSWYRARISSISEGVVSVHFIDYGSVDKVSIDLLKVLRPDWRLVPAASVDVILHDVHETDIDVESAKCWLEQQCLDRELRLEIVSASENLGAVHAYVYLAADEAHVNDQIYDLFALSPDVVDLPVTQDRETPQRLNTDNDIKETTLKSVLIKEDTLDISPFVHTGDPHDAGESALLSIEPAEDQTLVAVVEGALDCAYANELLVTKADLIKRADDYSAVRDGAGCDGADDFGADDDGADGDGADGDGANDDRADNDGADDDRADNDGADDDRAGDDGVDDHGADDDSVDDDGTAVVTRADASVRDEHIVDEIDLDKRVELPVVAFDAKGEHANGDETAIAIVDAQSTPRDGVGSSNEGAAEVGSDNAGRVKQSADSYRPDETVTLPVHSHAEIGEIEVTSGFMIGTVSTIEEKSLSSINTSDAFHVSVMSPECFDESSVNIDVDTSVSIPLRNNDECLELLYQKNGVVESAGASDLQPGRDTESVGADSVNQDLADPSLKEQGVDEAVNAQVAVVEVDEEYAVGVIAKQQAEEGQAPADGLNF